MKIDFKIVDHSSEYWYKAVKIREDILRKPFGLHFLQEELDEEKNHFHVIGRVEEEIIATAAMVPEKNTLKMQRVVVLERFRNENIGSEMMLFCETYAIKNNYTSIYCHARNSAVNFYLKNNYKAEGEYFIEDEIPHLKMKKIILQ